MISGYEVMFFVGSTPVRFVLRKKPTWFRLQKIWQTIIEESRGKGPDAPRKHDGISKLLSWFGDRRGQMKFKGLVNFGFAAYTINEVRIW